MSMAGIDLSALRRLLEVIGGDLEDLEELIEDYAANAPTLVAQMQAADENGDLGALRIAAHSLKSNAQDLGAIHLSELCASLEQQCKEGSVSEPGSAIATIATEEALAREALSQVKVEDLGLE